MTVTAYRADRPNWGTGGLPSGVEREAPGLVDRAVPRLVVPGQDGPAGLVLADPPRVVARHLGRTRLRGDAPARSSPAHRPPRPPAPGPPGPPGPLPPPGAPGPLPPPPNGGPCLRPPSRRGGRSAWLIRIGLPIHGETPERSSRTMM